MLSDSAYFSSLWIGGRRSSGLMLVESESPYTEKYSEIFIKRKTIGITFELPADYNFS